LSVDGVYQGPGGPTEDTSGGFTRGGWLVPHFDEQAGQFMTEVFEKPDAFLLGRRTYEIFTAYWPRVTDATADKLNTLPKYVVSNTLESADWQNSTAVRGDVATEVAKLKEVPRPTRVQKGRAGLKRRRWAGYRDGGLAAGGLRLAAFLPGWGAGS